MSDLDQHVRRAFGEPGSTDDARSPWIRVFALDPEVAKTSEPNWIKRAPVGVRCLALRRLAQRGERELLREIANSDWEPLVRSFGWICLLMGASSTVMETFQAFDRLFSERDALVEAVLAWRKSGDLDGLDFAAVRAPLRAARSNVRRLAFACISATETFWLGDPRVSPFRANPTSFEWSHLLELALGADRVVFDYVLALLPEKISDETFSFLLRLPTETVFGHVLARLTQERVSLFSPDLRLAFRNACKERVQQISQIIETGDEGLEKEWDQCDRCIALLA